MKLLIHSSRFAMGNDASGSLGLDAATKPALPAHEIAREALLASDADVAAAGARDLEQH
jgi:hypothetical protein